MTRMRPRYLDDLAALSAGARTARASFRQTMKALQNHEREEARERVREGKRAARLPPHAKLPDCGARCRDGHPCRRKCLPWRNRCPQHGGLSTGPKTAEGRARVAAAVRERWARWRRGEGPRPGRQPVQLAGAVGGAAPCQDPMMRAQTRLSSLL